MPKSIPASYDKNDVVNFRPKSSARARDWKDLIEDQNHLWATMHHCWGGYTWHKNGTPFYTTQTSFTTVDENGERDLDELNVCGTASRQLQGGDVELGFIVFGRAVEVQVLITNLETQTALYQSSVQMGSGWQWGDLWRTESITATGADMLRMQFDAQIYDDSNGYIWSLWAGERQINDVTKLPDGS